MINSGSWEGLSGKFGGMDDPAGHHQMFFCDVYKYNQILI